MKQISEGLWQGALRHVSEQGLPPGVDAVILMATQVAPVPLRPGVLFLYFPIDDNANGADKETWGILLRLAQFLKDFNVLTICHMGENRSGLMSALILRARNISAKDAVDMVQSAGPLNSANQAHSFWNPGFVRQVLAS